MLIQIDMKEINVFNYFDSTCSKKFPHIFSFVSMDLKPWNRFQFLVLIPWIQKLKIWGNFVLQVESKSLENLISFISI